MRLLPDPFNVAPSAPTSTWSAKLVLLSSLLLLAACAALFRSAWITHSGAEAAARERRSVLKAESDRRNAERSRLDQPQFVEFLKEDRKRAEAATLEWTSLFDALENAVLRSKGKVVLQTTAMMVHPSADAITTTIDARAATQQDAVSFVSTLRELPTIKRADLTRQGDSTEAKNPIRFSVELQSRPASISLPLTLSSAPTAPIVSRNSK